VVINNYFLKLNLHISYSFIFMLQVIYI
jgi:hypothetical protein